MRRRKRSAIDFRLEIAPVNLIDLLLVMLIFFVTTTTFLQLRMIELGLPESDAPSLQKSNATHHVVNIDEACMLFLDAVSVETSQLGTKLSQLKVREKTARFEIAADAESPHRCFVDTLSIIQKAGITDIGILTEPKE